VHDVQLAFAHSSQTVFYAMAGVMGVTFLLAARWLPNGRVVHTARLGSEETPSVHSASQTTT